MFESPRTPVGLQNYTGEKLQSSFSSGEFVNRQITTGEGTVSTGKGTIFNGKKVLLSYTGIAVLIGDGVLKCLKSVTDKMENNGTIIYIQLMRNIRDCFFDKSLSPSRRVHLIWKVVFFL